MWSSQGSRNFLLSLLTAVLVVTGYVGAGGPMPAPFTGDTGAGGRQGEVPAPAAGDAAAGKVLGASGGWVVGATGDVVGPASSVDNQVPRYDGATGKLLQASLMYCDDIGSLSLGHKATYSGVVNLTIGNPLTGGVLNLDALTPTNAVSGGTINFRQKNTTGATVDYTTIQGGAANTTSGVESGLFNVGVLLSGVQRHLLFYDPNSSNPYLQAQLGLQLGRYPIDGVLVFDSWRGVTNYTTKIQMGTPTQTAITLTLPPDDGTSGQVLSTDGSGVLTWKPTWQGCTFSLAGGAAAAVSTGAHWEGAIYLPDAVYLTGWRLRGESGTSEVTVKRASFVDYYGATTSILTGTTIAKTACCTSLATNIATSPETAIAADTYLLISVTAASETILALDLFGTKQ